MEDETVELAFGVNESYSLTVDGTKAAIHSATVFGALRGMETFVQLAVHSNSYAPGSLSVRLSSFFCLLSPPGMVLHSRWQKDAEMEQ